MKFVFDDGGRSKYFKASGVGDCVCRAICNAGGYDYMEVYKLLKAGAKRERITKRNPTKSSVRDGCSKKTATKVLETLGWKWNPTMEIGSGCKVHLTDGELPMGNLIVQVSNHFTCVKDGVLYDTYDCSRDGTRCVYGYYTKEF